MKKTTLKHIMRNGHDKTNILPFSQAYTLSSVLKTMIRLRMCFGWFVCAYAPYAFHLSAILQLKKVFN